MLSRTIRRARFVDLHSGRTADSICSLPPCGGGLGRGVVRLATPSATSHDPHPQPLPTRTRVYPSSSINRVEVGLIRLRLGRGARRARSKLWINNTGTRCSLALVGALVAGTALPVSAQQTTPIGVSYQP